MKNERFKRICHFIAGLILLPIAFKMFEYKKFAICIILLLIAFFFLFVSSALDWFEKTLGSTAKLIFLFESLTFAAVSFIYLELMHKKFLLIFLAITVIYFLLFLYFLYNKDKRKKRYKKHRSSSHH
jgi:membrane-bound ClpP family serine protease